MAPDKSVANFIFTPHPHDVLLGRGNLANRHPGNEHFRALVKCYKQEYVVCPKASKPMYSQLIYDQIRSMYPPGRFLKQDPTTKLWSSIGKKKAVDKTRQALREGATELLNNLEAGKEDQEDTISASCTSRSNRNEAEYVCSLEVDNNSSLFEWSQSQNTSGHMSVMSDASLDSMIFPGSITMHKHSATTEGTESMQNQADTIFKNTSRSEMAEFISNQVGEGNDWNNIIYSQDEITSLLRAAHFHMIQLGINEWQQLCNHHMLQNTKHDYSCLQSHQLNPQLQMQNKWNQAVQQVNNQSLHRQNSQQGTLQSDVGPFKNINPDLNRTTENRINSYAVQTVSNISPTQVSHCSTHGNNQGITLLLAVLQNKAVGLNTSNLILNQTGAEGVTVTKTLALQPYCQLVSQRLPWQHGHHQQQLSQKHNGSNAPQFNNNYQEQEDVHRQNATAKIA